MAVDTEKIELAIAEIRSELRDTSDTMGDFADGWDRAINQSIRILRNHFPPLQEPKQMEARKWFALGAKICGGDHYSETEVGQYFDREWPKADA
jgi:hypothetical protein